MLLAAGCPFPIQGAGVTVITHGQWSGVRPWVIPMAADIAHHPEFPAHSFSCYELYFTDDSAASLAYRTIGGSIPPTKSLTGEIFIKLEWGDQDEYSTDGIAEAFFAGLTNRNFIPGLEGHALCELPMHLIGHSRGASLVSHLARKFGEHGIWVDQLTTLDPHPRGNDPPVVVPDNVLYADNYWQSVHWISGHHVDGSFNRHMPDLAGGYSFITGDHANIHLWYHGTINQSVPLTVDGVTLSANMATNWYTPGERGTTGFFLSRIAGGDRLSSDTPAGVGTAMIRDGMNKIWPLGAGRSFNRTRVLRSGDWPNPIRLTQSVNGSADRTYTMTLTSQSPGTTICNLYWDADHNPFNANNRLMATTNIPPMAPTSLQRTELRFTVPHGFPHGVFRPYVELIASGNRRYLYRHTPIIFGPDNRGTRLSISRESADAVHLDVESAVGTILTLDIGELVGQWTPVGDVLLIAATNRMTVTPTANRQAFYRMRLSTNYTRFNRHLRNLSP